MTFSEVVTEICSRVSDPEKDTYGDRATSLFYAGISALVSGGEWTVEDIPYLYRTKTILSKSKNENDELQISGDTNELDDGLNILKIVDIVGGKTVEKEFQPEIKYRRITHSDFNQLSVDNEYGPHSDERFYLIDLKGTDTQIVKFILSADDNMASARYKVSYIVAPLESDFTDDTQLSERFSDSFIWKVIDFAEAKIKKEIQGA